MATARVLIVDDHPMFAESIALLFEREDDFHVVGIAATATEALHLAEELQPDVAVVDYQLPDGDGTTAAAGIRKRSPETAVILLTGMRDDEGIAAAAVQAGCAGFLTKDTAGSELIEAARVVHSGHAFIRANHLDDLHRGLAIEKLKSEFLARISHELRTPLAGILGYAQLLTHRALSREHAHRIAQEIVASGERLQRIVEILEFTASSATGRFELHPMELSPASVIDDAVARWSAKVGASHPLHAAGNQPTCVVHADAHWLNRALDELIDNAVKFSPEGSDVELTAEKTTIDGRRMLEFTVTDHGAGLTPAESQAAFEEFFQLDTSDTREHGGLGLGLSLVRRVALAHGGTVAYRHAEPHGSSVSVAFPLSPEQ